MLARVLHEYGYSVLEALTQNNPYKRYPAVKHMRRTIRLTQALVAVALALTAATTAHAGPPKITICHKPPGNPDNAHTIQVNIHAWPAHKAHDDSLGECSGGGAGSGDSGGSGSTGGGNTGDGEVDDDTFEVVLCDQRKGDHGHTIQVSRTGQITVQNAECQ